ncbi:MAG: TRAP transporter fused permease subunit, partial [Kiloniellales bacterium]|nr:TRAP transporter fused permease subunit [Kiloniellales bacterium]
MAETANAVPEVAPEDLQKELEEIEYAGRKLSPRMVWVVGTIATLWSLFQLWIASPLPFWFGFGIIVDVPARGIHLAFGLLLCYLIFPFSRRTDTSRVPLYDIGFALLGCFCAAYIWLAYEGLSQRAGILLEFEDFLGLGFTLPFEQIIGGIGILLLLEATRRGIGIPLVILASFFLLYSLFGQLMPDIISHRGMSLTRMIGYQWFGGEAIFGIPIDVPVDFVFLFVLFGAMLDKAGAGRYFLDLAFAAVGQFRGGPAKAAILASGMTGMISGSSIANTVTTGTFTIPVMRSIGMPAVKAGAIEVAASVNGQIMPPIMGAAAFVMAELLGITYYEVIVAAFIPAFISYLALLYISHLEALKLGLTGLPKSEIPPLLKTFLGGVHFLVPVVVLIYLLMVEKWSPESAVFYSILILMGIIVVQHVWHAIRTGEESAASGAFSAVKEIVDGLIGGA